MLLQELEVIQTARDGACESYCRYIHHNTSHHITQTLAHVGPVETLSLFPMAVSNAAASFWLCSAGFGDRMEQTSSRDSDSSTSTPTKPSSSELSTVRKGTQTSYENRRRNVSNSCSVVMCYVIKDIHDRWKFPIYGIAIIQRVCMYVCMYRYY